MIRYSDTLAKRLPIKGKRAVFSLDLETDYASGRLQGLRGVKPLLDILSRYGVVPTIFIEGTILIREPQLVLALDQGGADLQLHCRDHQIKGGDTPELLAQSVELFKGLLGRRPLGYRGNTFNISHELLSAQKALAFAYDSSILPARFGYGANPDANWRRHDCVFRLGKYDLNEIPVATIPLLGAPFIHSYVCLGQMLSFGRFLRLAPLPRLLVYDMHMVDLVRCLDSLSEASLPATAKRIYANMWPKARYNTFKILEALLIRLHSKGYTFSTMTQLHNEMSHQ